MSFRALVEQTRQRLRVGERNFRPTADVRNPMMLTEAEDFARHLSTFKAAARKYEREINTFLKSVPVAARANLPRVWVAVDGTAMCEPLRHSLSHDYPVRVGGDFEEVQLSEVREIMTRRIDSIIRPIDRWMESLQVVKARMRKVESFRLELDSRKRYVQKKYLRELRRLEEAEEDAKATPTEEDDLEVQKRREDHAREALHEQRQLEAVAASYAEQEKLVFEQLSGLVRDAAWFKSYVASTFLVLKDTMQASLIALGHMKRPLPGYSPEAGGVPGVGVGGEEEYGKVAGIDDLVKAMPRIVVEGGRPRHSLSTVLPTLELHAKRATAQPLQVAADVSGAIPPGAPVPPVIKGATGISAEELAAAREAEENLASGNIPTGYNGDYKAEKHGHTGAFDAMRQEVAAV